MKSFLVLAIMFCAAVLSSAACADLPSAGTHTWAVDSFFDITYRIDFQTSTQIPVYAGGTMVQRNTDPQPLPGGGSTIDTEMLQLSLTGTSPGVSSPIWINLYPPNPCNGKTDSSGDGQRIDSFFDVFIEFRLPDGTLHNNQAARFQGGGNSFFDVFVELAAPIDLYDENNQFAGTLQQGSMHITPEPSGFLALAGGLLPMGYAIRRRMKK